MLCNGVSFHTLCPILSFLRSEPTSPLLGLAFWSIVTSFSGCDTFLAAVRSLSPPQEYVLLSACDIDSRCRRAIHYRKDFRIRKDFQREFKELGRIYELGRIFKESFKELDRIFELGFFFELFKELGRIF